MSNIDPEILDELENERNYARSGSRKTARLKLEKETGALVRFLPVQLGAKKTWFGRVGLHWVGKFPAICPRETAPSLGGDPESHCPVCDMVEKLAAARNESVQKVANKARAWPQYLTYVLVFELHDAEGNATVAKQSEMWVPHELWLPKTAFVDLSALYKRMRKADGSGPELTDPIGGYDVTISRNRRGDMIFQVASINPMVDKPDNEILDFCAKVCSFKPTETAPSTDEKLNEAALKLEDAAYAGRQTSGSSRRGGFNPDESDELDPVPVRRRTADEPAPRRAPPDEEEVPRRREAPAEPARRAEVAEEAPRRAAPVARTEPPAPTARRELTPPPARRAEPPPAQRAAPASSDLDPDELPPEVHDHAPAASEDVLDDEPPPPLPPAKPITAPRSGLSDAMRENLRTVARGRTA